MFNAQNGFGNLTGVKGTGGNYVNAGLTFNITGDALNAQTVTATTTAANTNQELNTVQVRATSINPETREPYPDSAIAGLSFYMSNAVMYDLQIQTIGYTPFYVTIASFSNGLTVSQEMGPLGVRGVISGANG